MSGVTIHRDFIQGSDEWLATRRGLLTASEIDRIITPTLKVADNDKSRSHLYELLAQRITNYTEPSYIGDDMLRGMEGEILARQIYAEKFAPVEEVGFITNDEWGFTIGCSPDALVGDDGMLEIKTRRQKFQVATIIDGKMPDDYAIQVQTELLVTRRAWCDFVSYSGGMPMIVIRVYPDAKIQDAIIDAAAAFEDKMAEKQAIYDVVLETNKRLVPTERRIEQEMFA
jgi:predicted phage-related endonuclease